MDTLSEIEQVFSEIEEKRFYSVSNFRKSKERNVHEKSQVRQRASLEDMSLLFD